MATLTFKYGTMSSSKTAQLLILAYNLEDKGINFLCFKPDVDTRSGIDKIKSRIECLERDAITIYAESNIYNSVYEAIETFDSDNCLQYILIDEAQFLSTEQVNQLSDIVDILKINVICYGLRTDFKTHLFEGTKRLFEVADKLEEISTVCECGEKALYNARVDILGDIIIDGEQIVVGDENYVCLCRNCYNELINK